MFQVSMAFQVNDYFAPIIVESLHNASMVPNLAGNYFMFFGEFSREVIIAPPRAPPVLVAEPVIYEQVAEVTEEEDDLLTITPQGLANNILAGPPKSPRRRNRKKNLPR
jgi:hypothetical protein